MSSKQLLGILLPEDGPTDYEWYSIEQIPDMDSANLPEIKVGQIDSGGHHERHALTALGSVERLAVEGEALVRDGADAIVWACTSASFIGGLEWAQAQTSQLERHLGVPVTSTALAFKQALAHLDCHEVDLLGAYPDEVTQRFVGFLVEAGVDVNEIDALDCAYASNSHGLDILTEVGKFCERHSTSERPLLVPDTAINTLGLMDSLNRDAGRLVLTANQVSLWAGLCLLGRTHYPRCITHFA